MRDMFYGVWDYRAAVLFFTALLFLAHSATGEPERAVTVDEQIRRNQVRIDRLRDPDHDRVRFKPYLDPDICHFPCLGVPETSAPASQVGIRFSQRLLEAKLNGKTEDYRSCLLAMQILIDFNKNFRAYHQERLARYEQELIELENYNKELKAYKKRVEQEKAKEEAKEEALARKKRSEEARKKNEEWARQWSQEVERREAAKKKAGQKKKVKGSSSRPDEGYDLTLHPPKKKVKGDSEAGQEKVDVNSIMSKTLLKGLK